MRWMRGCGLVVAATAVLSSTGSAQMRETAGAPIIDFLLRSEGRARALFEHACDAGDARGCRALRDLEDLASGRAFMAENARKKGVRVTASGLQYQVLRKGDGPRPKPSDIVTVRYTSTFTDGTVFDSSSRRHGPARFAVDGVIAGISEGLRLMRVGSTYRFVIPPDLAYGPRGAGPVGPDQTLVIQVDLVKIDDPPMRPGE